MSESSPRPRCSASLRHAHLYEWALPSFLGETDSRSRSSHRLSNEILYLGVQGLLVASYAKQDFRPSDSGFFRIGILRNSLLTLGIPCRPGHSSSQGMSISLSDYRYRLPVPVMRGLTWETRLKLFSLERRQARVNLI